MVLNDNTTSPFVFSSAEGHTLCTSILDGILPYQPHIYQLRGICRALDSSDVFAVTPTGSGKSAVLTMYLFILRAILFNRVVCPIAVFK